MTAQSPVASEVLTYPIVETFHSLQGEGRWTGISAFFIRLGGCDVGCPWCDTKISWNAKRHPQVSIADLQQQVNQANPRIIVITGGEPLMHDLAPLTDGLRLSGKPLHLETSGAHVLSGDWDWITLSPKPFKQPQPEIYAQADELKVVINSAADLVWAESQAAKMPATSLKYLQPQWQNQLSPQLIFNYVLTHADWRMSLQTHKFLGVQ